MRMATNGAIKETESKEKSQPSCSTNAAAAVKQPPLPGATFPLPAGQDVRQNGAGSRADALPTSLAPHMKHPPPIPNGSAPLGVGQEDSATSMARQLHYSNLVMARVHNLGGSFQVSCPYCHIYYTTREYFRSHFEICRRYRRKETELVCPRCNEHFDDAFMLLYHVGRSTLDCILCLENAASECRPYTRFFAPAMANHVAPPQQPILLVAGAYEASMKPQTNSASGKSPSLLHLPIGSVLAKQPHANPAATAQRLHYTVAPSSGPQLKTKTPVPSNSIQTPDVQVAPLVPLDDKELCAIWKQQLTRESISFMEHMDAFILLSPNKDSNSPISSRLRYAWKALVPESERSEVAAVTGICCTKCLYSLQFTGLDWIQFVKLSPYGMYDAVKELCQHMKGCRLVRQDARRAGRLLQPEFSPDDDSIAWKAFLDWFCDSHGICKRPKQLPAPGPADAYRLLARDAVARYRMNTIEQVLKEMEHAVSIGARKIREGKGVLASDLTNVPTKGPLTEHRFHLELMEHIEIVRVTKETASLHELQLMRERKIHSLILFQCHSCHGQCCLGESPDTSPFVIFDQAQDPTRMNLLIGLISLVYHHVHACPKVSDLRKRKLSRVRLDPKSHEFKTFANYFRRRVLEWTEFVDQEVKSIEVIEKIEPRKDVDFMVPVNRLFEDSSLWSSSNTTTPNNNATLQISELEYDGQNSNDVIEGIPGSCEYSGNKRFRVLVSKNRDEFMSTTMLEEKTQIAKRVVDMIERRGGSFLTFDPQGTLSTVSSWGRIQRCLYSLEHGFLRPWCPRPTDSHHGGRRQGRGSKVLMALERAPTYNLLDNVITPSEVQARRVAADASLGRSRSNDGENEIPTPKRQCLDQPSTAKAVQDLM